MRNSLMTRGCAALATILCVTACASVAVAQTQYNWQGGSGTSATVYWAASNSSITPWATSSVGSFYPTAPSYTQSQAWVNDGTGVATFGYLTISGSGAANTGSISAIGDGVEPSLIPSDFQPINLDPNNIISANSLVFGEQSSSSGAYSQYSLNGGTLMLTANGTGTSPNITFDLTNLPNSSYISTLISSNLVVGTGGTGNLAFCSAVSASSASSYYANNVYLSGPANFANGIVAGSPIMFRDYSALIFTTTQALNYTNPATGLPEVHNFTLGNQADLLWLASNLTSGTVGTITLDPTIGLNGTYPGSVDQQFGSYTRNTGQYAYGVNGIGCLARIGAGTSYAGSSYVNPTLYVGAITGNGDVAFTNGYASDGEGVVVLTQSCNYTGDTFLCQSGVYQPSANECVAMVRLKVNNALPIGTNLIFGDQGTSTTGLNGYTTAYQGCALDLNGCSQQVASLAISTGTSSTTTSCHFAGINNYNPTTCGTLTICNNVPQFNTIEAQFRAVIGKQILDADTISGSTTADNLPNNSNNIALVLGLSNPSNTALSLAASTANNGTLTLGVGILENAASQYVPFTQSNTYYGGTTINSGALFAANGSTYNDGLGHGMYNNGSGGTAATNASSVPNSATGTGPVVVNAGGTFGGSKVGGAVGMPDSVAFAQGAVGPTGGSLNAGAVIVNNGGYLLPGGGYYSVSGDTTGNGGDAWVPGGSARTMPVAIDPAFVPTVGPTFHVLGNLILNSGANVNFNFNSSGGDSIVVGGALNLTGLVTIGINPINGATINNDTPIFTFGTLTGGTANIVSPTAAALGDSFAIVGNQIDLVTGGPASLVWNGSHNSGAWDNQTTSNFTAAGVASTFKSGDNVTFDDTGSNTAVNVTSSGVQPGSVTFNNNAKTYTIQGGPIMDGPSFPTAVTVQGGGTVVLANTNTYTGGTTIQLGSTLQMNSAAALPLNGTVNISGNSTLTLNYNDGGSTANSNSSTINFASPGSPAINVPTGTATLSGAINSTGVGLTKTGSGTLLLTNAAGSSDTDSNNVNGGFVEVNSTYGGTDGYAGYSALGSGSVYLASAGSASGGGLWLNNVQVGVNQNQSKTDTLGDVYMYPGAVFKGTGSGAALAHASANVELNWNKATGYSPGSVIFTTGTSPSDVLALHSEVEQTDPNYYQANENVNYTLNNSGYQGTTNANYLITAHVQGAGTVKLQSGGIDGNVFGGAWSVDSGILQVGPFVSTTAAITSASGGTNAGQWAGPGGEVLNGLGFKSAQNPTGSILAVGNPDLPNAVAVNTGGMLAIANDQINGNAVAGLNNPVNGTPAYYRNQVILNGGSLAATGAEVTFNPAGSSSGTQGVIEQSNAAVVARLGGGFTSGSTGVTSTILTYDPNGQAVDSTGTPIAGDTGLRTVELVGGTRVLNNQSPGLQFISGSGMTSVDSGLGFLVQSTSSSVTLQYQTNWSGNLLIASSNGVGGTFNIKRSGGIVSVASGAQMTIQGGSTVNISNDNSSTLIMSTVPDATYGFMVSNSTLANNGVLPVLNNVLQDPNTGKTVAIANNGTFNVNAGSQTMGAVTGTGTFNVTNNPLPGQNATVASVPGIQQSSASVASGAKLQITSPGASAPSMTIANAGTIEVVSGTQQSVQQITGGGALQLDAGSKLSLTGANGVLGYQGTTVNSVPSAFSVLSSLAIAGTTNAWTGDLNIGYGGFVLTNATTAEVAMVSNMIAEGADKGKWDGTEGITSSDATANPNNVGIASMYVTSGSYKGDLIVAAELAGDVNMDGTVNSKDLAIVNSNWLGSPSNGVTNWQIGDLNYDGTVNSKDLALVNGNWLSSSMPLVAFGPSPSSIAGGAEAVPEPGTLALLAAGLIMTLGAALRRRARNITG